jgi:hypothetical protein
MKSQKRLKIIGLNFITISIATVILIIFFEGAANFAYFFSKLKNARIAAESIYTEYDKELGWINKKNQRIKDMYGKNIALITNSEGFRNSSDIRSNKPIGKKRWIFLGDSFTFGYGVDNDHCYCSYISQLEPQIEYVNMGQGGYGCDQMYLWYLRDGIELDHDVMIFSFITDDFNRMVSDMFYNYPKPYLDIVNNQIEVKNVPVPNRSFIMRNFPRFMEVRDQLGINWLAGKISSSVNISGPGKSGKLVIENNEKFANIITQLFYNLNNELAKNNRVALFIYLPKMSDYNQDESFGYRNFLKERAQQFNWNYLDLIEDFRKIRPDSIPLLFIQKDIPGYLGSVGHYTELGNKVIAELIISKIKQNPKLSAILDK